MPLKSGGSHALSAFVSILVGAAFSEYLNLHLEVLTRWIGTMVITVSDVVVPRYLAGVLVISTILSFFWGITYHQTRHR